MGHNHALLPSGHYMVKSAPWIAQPKKHYGVLVGVTLVLLGLTAILISFLV